MAHLTIVCPRCGKKSNIHMEKTPEGNAYTLTCELCKTRLYIPNHPFLEMGVDIVSDGIAYYDKLKTIGFLLKGFMKK